MAAFKGTSCSNATNFLEEMDRGESDDRWYEEHKYIYAATLFTNLCCIEIFMLLLLQILLFLEPESLMTDYIAVCKPTSILHCSL